MKKNILLPTDFSDNAWSAAVYALKLYEEVECTFYFLHSTKTKASIESKFSHELMHDIEEKAIKELQQLKEIAKTADANSNHSFENIISTNDLQDVMQTVIKKDKIDLVVMGTKGATKSKKLIFGSNTVKAIKHVKGCPVLVIPDEFDYVNPSQIAFPTDFSHLYGEELIPLKQLANLNDSMIRVVHINKESHLSALQDYNLEELKSALENYDHSYHWMPNYGKKEQAIKDFIEELNINILVMINYRHSIIESIIREPVIKEIGYQPKIPFLVIPYLN